ncbi:potassium channel family protein [Ostreibacterium oceani]|uniref:Potassium transporter TrkA n=1 Tax=Ostreibacterium oceani TaxID=2654998 RepID=A0A6N7ETC0_9GAMM|nr:NAD-binding protein [Ostreibacterium oceani]MPV85163.1 potassium transporter TrkA [Ostreibacterium oceani]
MQAVRHPIIYIILKRMRAPLIVLILAYAIAITGLALIPGVHEDGTEWHFTIFRAFYFFSYVATTIGFGEIPYDFTDTQRLWVSFCIYLTVISWLFAIGEIISLFQDPALKIALAKHRFSRRVQRINSKFYIICGYGETGAILLSQLNKQGYQCVVIDQDQARINLLELDANAYKTPFIMADASAIDTLKMAGIEHPQCRAVIAITNNDAVNVKISAAAKLIRSHIKVICRVHSKESMANATSFDTDYVINPERIYAEGFGMTFRKPSVQQLINSLLKRPGSQFAAPMHPPKGHWVICGFGRFGQEMARFLEYEGIDYTIVTPEEIPLQHVIGTGTEAVTLKAAGIRDAVGIVAGTDNDTNNFSIIMTARNLNPNLYQIALQNRDSNRAIFQSAGIDSVMEASRLLVWRILPFITQPTLYQFIRLARHENEAWANTVSQQLAQIGQTVPYTYLLRIDNEHAPAITRHVSSGNILRLQDVYPAPLSELENPAPEVLALMLIRDGKFELVPKANTPMKNGDIFLLASDKSVRNQIDYIVRHDPALYYLLHGKEQPVSIVVAKLKKYLQAFKQWRRQQRKHKNNVSS